jgi:hypothetical protein
MVVPHPCFKIREESRGIDLGGYANEAICSPAAGFFFSKSRQRSGQAKHRFMK